MCVCVLALSAGVWCEQLVVQMPLYRVCTERAVAFACEGGNTTAGFY